MLALRSLQSRMLCMQLLALPPFADINCQSSSETVPDSSTFLLQQQEATYDAGKYYILLTPVRPSAHEISAFALRSTFQTPLCQMYKPTLQHTLSYMYCGMFGQTFGPTISVTCFRCFGITFDTMFC